METKQTFMENTMSDEVNQILGITNEQIAARAYTKFERRGFVDGFDIQDWLQAELELANERITITEFIVGGVQEQGEKK
jgi:hypothetical protein